MIMKLDSVHYFEHKLEFEIDPSDLSDALLEGKNVIVIDARKPEAFERERIPGAINLPHRTMNETTTAQLDRAASYVVYCDGVGCNAAMKGSYNMAKLGFKVKELMGGIEYWKVDGYATEGLMHAGSRNTHCAC